MNYYAHTVEDKGPDEWQSLEEHLYNVGKLAAKFSGVFNAAEWGGLVGRLHDIGKYRPEFQEKLVKQSSRRVDHKGVGAKLAYEKLENPGKLISYCIAGHHGGLPNGRYSSMSGGTTLKELIEQAVDLPEGQSILSNIDIPELPFQPRDAFQLTFFVRMLFSALVDADFLDTEAFLDPQKTKYRRSGPSLEVLQEKLEAKLASFTVESRINHLRAEILDHSIKQANLNPGLFTLTVPTGGGKTVTSMAFALKHALKHGLRRIVYVIPYTSIIEQNAKVFRDIFPLDTVVEHHSNFDQGVFGEDKDQFGSGLRHRLACENWDSPVIVTTNVQFFESLYAAKPSRCRKLHNLAGSVIILDEAQMLPVEYLRPCLKALDELSRNYKASIILCTATQPALNKRDDFKYGLEGIREIAPDPNRMHKEFLRTRLEDVGIFSLEDVADYVNGRNQVLCIVNTRARASRLFDLIKDESGAKHLSALMCPAHRAKVLEGVKQDLKTGGPCRLISTQLIEAGVDISFPEVIREYAGLDSIVQAAGRCNREGESVGLGKVSVFMPKEGLASVFKQKAGNAGNTLRHYADDPFSPAAVEYYFSETYWLKQEFLDEKKILDEFDIPRPNWAFRDVAERFRIIDRKMIPVIIPFDTQAEKLIQSLRFAEIRGGILRSLQQYTVQIYKYHLDRLDSAGALEFIDGSYAVLINEEFYTSKTGLLIPESGNEYGACIV
ncbi:MAG: CRISPR-associated helicase Cas3' [Desulfonatronovibrio sp.]